MQSRIKELEKIERIEIPEEEPVIHFKFPQPAPSGRMVVEADGLAKSYGPKQVFANARFSIERGDRVALVGVNGAGKSTLIKLLTGAEAPSAGTVRLGHNVVSEYFAQDQYKVLDGDSRMLDDISRAALKVPESALRSLLGCFLFSGDDVFKPLGVLSGGERNRYALARILVSPSNFLLLDEPTNHLDMRAKDVLLDAMMLSVARLFLFRTIAISSTGSPRAFSKLKAARSRPTKGTTRTTCGARSFWPPGRMHWEAAAAEFEGGVGDSHACSCGNQWEGGAGSWRRNGRSA